MQSNTSAHSRRDFLRYSAVASAALALPGCARTMAQQSSATMGAQPAPALPDPMSTAGGQFADVNGARLFYQATGTGTPLLLIHGYPLSGDLFSRNRDALSQHFRVITLDQRGYGRSQAPGVPDDIGTYAQDALDLLTSLGIQQAVIGGHSMGGPITLEMYKRAPERFKGMILIDTNAKAASPIEAALWNGFVDQVQKMGVASLVDPLNKNMLTGATRMHQPALATFLGTIIKQASKDAAIGGAKALAGRPDYTSMLGQIRVPTLVYVGVEDTLYPPKIAMEMQQAIPGSTLASIPGGAHAAVLEVPDKTNQAILSWGAGM